MFYPNAYQLSQFFDAGYKQSFLITGTDKNGNSISIGPNNVREGTFQIDRYCCNGDKLEIGNAIAAQLSFNLENSDGTYDAIAFEGTELQVILLVATSAAGTSFTPVYCGYFTPDEQPRRLASIEITALDRMTKFDRYVDAAQFTSPYTVANLIDRVCTICGVTRANQSLTGFPNYNVSITALPEGQQITYRNLIQWCAGLMATNAWMDWEGKLRFTWYDNNTDDIDEDDDDFLPTYYCTTIDTRYSSDIFESALTITGVEYTNDAGVTIIEGTDDYAIDLSGNLLAKPIVATVLPAINTFVNGFTYWPYTARNVSAPYLWPMDAAAYKKDRPTLPSTLTNVAFGINGATALESKGMTYAINRLKQPNPLTKEQIRIVNEVTETAIDDFDDTLTQEEIFNRLTDNRVAQGMFLDVNTNQLYINATYLNAGIINGDLVRAKKLVILDSNNNVIARYDSTITLGNEDDAHALVTPKSFQLVDGNDAVYMSAGDVRDGNDALNLTFTGDGTTRQFLLASGADAIYVTAIQKVTVDGVQLTSGYGLTGTVYEKYLGFTTAPANGADIRVWYTYTQANMHYTMGVRRDGAAIGDYSMAEGRDNAASGENSHAEGDSNTASGEDSHAEGYDNLASGPYSHVEGSGNVAGLGACAHAEGSGTIANAAYSHAEGNGANAYGEAAHAEGNDTDANGDQSHAEGLGTVASRASQHVVGEYNVNDLGPSGSTQSDRGTYVEIVGNGNADNDRSNARTLDWDGNEYIAGALSVGDAATTLANLGALPKAGGTMTGNLIVGSGGSIYERANTPSLYLQDTDGSVAGGIYCYASGSHQLLLRSFHTGDDNYENYNLPLPDASGNNSNYNVVTTKNRSDVLLTKSVDATTSANGNLSLGLLYTAGVPVAFNVKTAGGTCVYAIIGRYNTSDTGSWGAKIINELDTNGVAVLANTRVIGTLYYIPLT